MADFEAPRDRVLAGLLVVPFLLGAAAAPAGQAQVVFSFRDNQIIESSGLAVVDGLVVTTNDSGDTGRVFMVDPVTGKTVGVTAWADDPTDVEALAPDGHGGVWVGDIGDNTESRDSVQIAQVALGGSDLEPEVRDLTYPDGAHDAETLMRDPATGRLYIASKGPLGGELFEVPESGDGRMRALGDVLPLATDGAFLSDGSTSWCATTRWPRSTRSRRWRRSTSSSSPTSRRARAWRWMPTAACCSARKGCTPRC